MYLKAICLFDNIAYYAYDACYPCHLFNIPLDKLQVSLLVFVFLLPSPCDDLGNLMIEGKINYKFYARKKFYES